jgi:hypothetical protein
MQRGSMLHSRLIPKLMGRDSFLGAMPPLGPGRHVFRGMQDVDAGPSPDMTRAAIGSSQRALVLRI